MKIRSSALKCEFFAQQNYGGGANNMSELNKPPLETTKIELENILRWEDDGGRILNVGNPISFSFTNVTSESAKQMLNVSGITTDR